LVLKTPTHSAQHKSGWQANIYIADSLQAQLQSSNTAERQRAEMSVCKRFRAACGHKFPKFNLARVEWNDITLSPLHVAAPRVPTTMPAPTKSTPAPIVLAKAEDTRECDDCFNCEQLNDHHHCSSSGGCPLAVAWPSNA